VLLFVTCTTPSFFLLQHFYDLPSPGDTRSLAAPFEEFHAFGSVMLSILLYLAVLLVWRSPTGRFERASLGGWILVIATLVVASWSRTAWLLALILVPLIFATRRPHATLIISAIFAILVALIVKLPIRTGIDPATWSA
jgi:O-antigen ligase